MSQKIRISILQPTIPLKFKYFIGWTYVVTGALCLLVMIVLFVISRRNN